jgi:hypothetical protein
VLIEKPELISKDTPLLQWLDEDSESEQFTLVQSRKKKKRQSITLLSNQGQAETLRRSKITRPSVYRTRGVQENPEPSNKRHNPKKSS